MGVAHGVDAVAIVVDGVPMGVDNVAHRVDAVPDEVDAVAVAHVVNGIYAAAHVVQGRTLSGTCCSIQSNKINLGANK